MADDAVFCTECGTRMEAPKQNTTEQPQPQNAQPQNQYSAPNSQQNAQPQNISTPLRTASSMLSRRISIPLRIISSMLNLSRIIIASLPRITLKMQL